MSKINHPFDNDVTYIRHFFGDPGLNPTSANSPTPSSPSGRAKLHTATSATGAVPADSLLHRHRATASAHCCCWAPGGHLISAPQGSQPALRPAVAAAAMAEPRIATPSGVSVSPLLHFGSREWSSASVNLFIPHTQGQHGSDEGSSRKGNRAPPSRASPPGV